MVTIEAELKSIRDRNCTDCKLHRNAEKVCVSGRGLGHIVVVSSRPASPTYQAMLTGHLTDAGFEGSDFHFTHAVRCFDLDANIGKKDLKACAKYLESELALIDPDWILCLGNEALASVTGHSGIMKWRGRQLETVIAGRSRHVLATISPAAVSRNPGQKASYMADLRFFHGQIHDRAARVKPPTIHLVKTAEMFRKFKRAIEHADLASFDLETTIDGEFAPGAAIVSIAATLEIQGKVVVFAMPLYHPQSPFRKSWVEAVIQLVKRLRRVRKRIAHNGKFDCRWLREFSGDETIDITFDTMLAAHLLDENREKGLKPQATSRLGVPAWGIDTKNLLAYPIDEVLHYNALDTYYAYHVYLEEREELLAQPRLLRIFRLITMPGANRMIGVERKGAWVDRERLATNGKIARDMRAEVDRKLREYVPDPTSEAWPTNSKGRAVEVNFNRSNFAIWFLFEHLGLPVLARGKDKDDGVEGDPSMAEAVLLELRDANPAVNLMLERAGWEKKVAAFFNAYDELLTDEDRIHTTFKIAGTVTGRLSSGKADEEKITARAPRRGVNLQQVPRDPLVRGLFGAPPGYTFVEADFSQVELRVAAFLSREPTMMRLYQAGEDIHAATAAWVLGVPRSQVTKDDRKKAKAVNFGFVYGMGWRKFILTAFEKYELRFSESEAQDIRRLFFEQFPGLLRWHARQRRLVNNNRRVQSPIGRIRHLPDIDSPEAYVRGEAERQAINSPVQSFASDLCMLSLVLITQEFERLGLDASVIGNVHDALLFEVADRHVAETLPIIKDTMENLPLDRMFGIHLDVPIISDLKVGSHWGGARELTEEEVYDYRPST